MEPNACHYVLEDCESNVVIVENQKQLDKILQVGKFELFPYRNALLAFPITQVRDRLPHFVGLTQLSLVLHNSFQNVYDVS